MLELREGVRFAFDTRNTYALFLPRMKEMTCNVLCGASTAFICLFLVILLLGPPENISVIAMCLPFSFLITMSIVYMSILPFMMFGILYEGFLPYPCIVRLKAGQPDKDRLFYVVAMLFNALSYLGLYYSMSLHNESLFVKTLLLSFVVLVQSLFLLIITK